MEESNSRINRIKRILAAVLTGCAMLGWWGAIYPQFTLLPGTYQVAEEATETCDVREDSAPKEAARPAEDASALYWQIMSADRQHIRVKSRIWEEWKALRRAESEYYGSEEE